MRGLKHLGLFVIAVLCLALTLGLGIGLGLRLRGGSPSQSSQPTPVIDKALSALDQPAAASSAGVPTYATPSGSARHTIIVDVASRVSPAVVSIGVTKTTLVRQFDPFGWDPMFPYYSIARRNQRFPYLGSGFIIDKEGHVLTNYHVIEDANGISVTLTDRRTFRATLMDADRYLDIALLKIEGLSKDEQLPFVPSGNSDDIMIGETALAIGNPFGPLIADPRPSVSVGVVSAVQRSFRSDPNDPESRNYQDMIQTDAAINPGNSGGPLVNLDGEVIGINTFIFSTSGSAAGVAFSIPINRATRVVSEILKYGKLRAIRRDFEGMTLTPYIVQALDLKISRGVLVRSVDINSPAEQAGLAPGDVITAVEGKDIQDNNDLLARMLACTVGDKLRLSVNRQNKPVEIVYPITGVNP